MHVTRVMWCDVMHSMFFSALQNATVAATYTSPGDVTSSGTTGVAFQECYRMSGVAHSNDWRNAIVCQLALHALH
jgi:hypothetical protein